METLLKQTTELQMAHMVEPAAASVERSGWLGAVFILVISLLIMFHPVVFGDRTTVVSAAHCSSVMPGGAFGGDHDRPVSRQISRDPWSAASQSEAVPMFIGSILSKEHKLPLWNVYSGCGMPFLPNLQNQMFYPLNLITTFFPSNVAMDCFVLIRLALAGIFALLALRAIIPGSSAALVGAAGYMLTGYFLLHLNVLDLSVHLTIPALLLAIEVVIRKQCVNSVLFCAGIVALNLLGGHPECCFISLTFSGWYFLYRLLTVEGWHLRKRIFGCIAIGYLAGLMIALPEILPFLEYVRISDNCHDPAVTGSMCGLNYDHDWRRGLLSYIFPVGWAQKHFAIGFYGTTLAFLALIGACCSFKRIKRGEPERVTRTLMFFFGSAFCFMLLKRFGCPIVNWIGALPLFDMVIFCRYDEPLMAMCIATLAAFGVRSLQCGRAGPRLVAGVAVTFWLAVTALNFMYMKSAMVPSFDSQTDMRSNMVLGLTTLVATASLCLLAGKSARLRRALPVLVLMVFLYETFSGFMSQTFYGKDGLVQRSFEPYKGAPYIQFLNKNIDRNSRVFGLDGVLLPNWSAAFNLQDIRYIDSLCPSHYAELIAAFLPNPAIVYRGRGFDAMERTTYDAVAVRRLCALTSVRYLLSMAKLNEYDDLIVNFARKFGPKTSPEGLCFIPAVVVDGVEQPVMFQHPKFDQAKNEYEMPILVPDLNAVLDVDFVRNPDVACPARKVPVEAIVSIDACDSKELPQRFVFLNEDQSQQHATHYSIDLTRFAGKQVKVKLTSRPICEEECYWEWVGWKKMRFRGVDSAVCIYDREIKIYELPEAIPHAAVFTAAKLVEDDSQVLRELKRRSFAPLKSVVFSRKDLTAVAARNLSALDSFEPCRPARISKYESDRLEIELPAITKPSLLLLTDNCFPGWRALVDGREQEIHRGNQCFRAVLLPVGARTVRFCYDSTPFKVGVFISLLVLGALSITAGLALFRRRKAGRTLSDQRSSV